MGLSNRTNISNANNISYIVGNNPEHQFARTTRDMSFHLPKYGIR